MSEQKPIALSSLRTHINELDTELRALFLERMEVSAEVAAYKRSVGMAVLDPVREQAVLDRLCEGLDAPHAEAVSSLWKQIFELSRACQHRLLNTDTCPQAAALRAQITAQKPLPAKAKVACQGRRGAYAHHAVDALFAEPDTHFFPDWAEVTEAVLDGRCDYGVLPIENSTRGSVSAVYDLLRSRQVHIVRSCRLPIRHALLGLPGAELSDIREVRSHEQAIGQCAGWLDLHPAITRTEAPNTAMAAEAVALAGRRDLAAIASPDCAELYGLRVLVDDITDCGFNYTRFVCIARDAQITPDANKLSLIVTLPHRAGSLSALLGRFTARGLNLTKLESSPIPGRDFEFMFCIDLDAPDPAALPGLLDDLCAQVESMTVLGLYHEEK